MIKAVIFDCFGVLVGSGVWSQFEEAGGDLAEYGEELDRIVELWNVDKLTTREVYEQIINMLSISMDEWLAIVREDEGVNIKLFDLIASELKEDYKIGFLSNVGVGIIEHKIPEDLMDLFDSVILSGELGIQKPDPRIFQASLSQLGVEADEAIFIDDREFYLEGAKKVGLSTIQYKSFLQFKGQLEDILSDQQY